MKPIDVSVIVVNWNTKDILRTCLKSVYEQAGNIEYEIIIIDNASSDASVEMIRSEFPRVILIANDSNRGYAAALNQGMKVARGRYFLLLNSDIIICDSAIEKTVGYADMHLDAAVVGCQVREDDNKIHLTCRRFPSLLNLLLDVFGLNRLFKNNKFFGREFMLWWPRDSEREVEVVSGMFMLVRQQAVEKVGMMDESYFFLFEETDWCYRFSKSGWKMLFWPGAQVIHIHGGSQSRKKAGTKIAIQYQKNMLIFFRKHYGGVRCFIARVLLTVNSLLCFLVWGILKISRNLRGGKTQYEDEKIGIYRRVWWFCLIGIEPDRGGFRQFSKRVNGVVKDSIELFLAVFYWGFLRFLRKLPARVVLYYHAIKKKDVTRFENQMKYLAEFCRVVRASDINNAPQNGTKSVVSIIFDDAFADVRDNALPVLRSYGITAAVAVPTGVMGKSPDWPMEDDYEDDDEKVLDSKAIAELDHLGYEILSHTVSHCNLTQVNHADLKMELCESKHALEQILGHKVDGIAYPHGACNATVCQAAAEAGYQFGFSIEPRTVCQSANPLRIGRFKVTPNDSMIQFKLKVRGAYRVAALTRWIKRALTQGRRNL
jgi:GT2 family glycosyltransferase/peptidoglycan/xylan/chitin deacetylase (PgdA/CDA1 family)